MRTGEHSANACQELFVAEPPLQSNEKGLNVGECEGFRLAKALGYLDDGLRARNADGRQFDAFE